MGFASIHAVFIPSPDQLALQYAAKNPLTPFECDRILYEGTLTTLNLLVAKTSITDPLTKKLAALYHIPLTRGEFLP